MWGNLWSTSNFFLLKAAFKSTNTEQETPFEAFTGCWLVAGWAATSHGNVSISSLNMGNAINSDWYFSWYCANRSRIHPRDTLFRSVLMVINICLCSKQFRHKQETLYTWKQGCDHCAATLIWSTGRCRRKRLWVKITPLTSTGFKEVVSKKNEVRKQPHTPLLQRESTFEKIIIICYKLCRKWTIWPKQYLFMSVRKKPISLLNF